MSWTQHQKPWEKIRDNFKHLRPDLIPVSCAPTLSQLINTADKLGKPLDDFMREEWKRIYKSIDTRSGNIYGIRNPALMEYQSWLGISPIVKPKTKLLLTYSEAIDKLRDLKKEQNFKPSETDWEKQGDSNF